MNGAESLIQTLVNSGLDICFTNPGTSEMHFVAALDEVEGMRCVLCLFEGVVSGAADGYARMARKPASTLLHLGPGLGNALANVHNAKKGNVPMVNIVGDHATYHLQYDAPLTSDIEGIARTVSHWVHSSTSPEQIAADAARAINEAAGHRVATLILPADVSWGDNPVGAVPAVTRSPLNTVAPDTIAEAAAKLTAGKNAMVMVGGTEVSETCAALLNRLGQATGARVSTDTFPPRVARGAGRAKVERLPYLAELAIDHIKDVDVLLLAGAKPPVSFFAYPEVPSEISPPGCELFQLAEPGDDIEACLQSLLAAVGGDTTEAECYELVLPDLLNGPLDVNAVGAAFAHYLPEQAIVVDEGITSGIYCTAYSETARAHDWLNQTGGSIGWGMPAAVGAALACPDRKVVCLEGDGSAMYTISALWTMAREELDITVVIFNNRKYSILELEFARTGARGGAPGPKASSMLDVGQPDMDFAVMAEGMGVKAWRVATAEDFNARFAEAMSQRGPVLIDALVPTALS
ncbi:MAG: acetolactate synthase large subunit [Pseudomonadota bacterium]